MGHNLPDATGSPRVDCDFPGGNAVVERVDGDHIHLRQDVRDTKGDWFYWHFRVRSCAGRELTVQFTNGNVLGSRGPAASFDGGMSWSWLGLEDVNSASFRCRVPEDVDEARFCFSVPYLEENLTSFLAGFTLSPYLRCDTLCRTAGGRDVELLHVGNLTGQAQVRVLLTARHHCCEMIANYVLEGILRTAIEDPRGAWLREQVEFFVVPFVDKDGVQNGDQGKNRMPRDHNRDYAGASVHASVRALRERVPSWSQGRLRMALDLHCPYIRGPGNEAIFFVGGRDPRIWANTLRLVDILEHTQDGPLVYRSADNLPFGRSWNTGKNYTDGKSFSTWAAEIPGIVVSSSVEIPYANVRELTVTPDRARAFGRDLALAAQVYLQSTQKDA